LTIAGNINNSGMIVLDNPPAAARPATLSQATWIGSGMSTTLETRDLNSTHQFVAPAIITHNWSIRLLDTESLRTIEHS
jgi:hypothetical protein